MGNAFDVFRENFPTDYVALGERFLLKLPPHCVSLPLTLDTVKRLTNDDLSFLKYDIDWGKPSRDFDKLIGFLTCCVIGSLGGECLMVDAKGFANPIPWIKLTDKKYMCLIYDILKYVDQFPDYLDLRTCLYNVNVSDSAKLDATDPTLEEYLKNINLS